MEKNVCKFEYILWSGVEKTKVGELIQKFDGKIPCRYVSKDKKMKIEWKNGINFGMQFSNGLIYLYLFDN